MGILSWLILGLNTGSLTGLLVGKDSDVVADILFGIIGGKGERLSQEVNES